MLTRLFKRKEHTRKQLLVLKIERNIKYHDITDQEMNIFTDAHAKYFKDNINDSRSNIVYFDKIDLQIQALQAEREFNYYHINKKRGPVYRHLRRTLNTQVTKITKKVKSIYFRFFFC